MSAASIEWTRGDDGTPGATWNPVTGCTEASQGCDHCYALTLARRLKAMGQPRYQHDGHPHTSDPGFGATTHPDALGEPLRWRTPRLVFVNSIADLFHAKVPAGFLTRVWATMAQTPEHTYQLLTKRPERARRLLSGDFPQHVADHPEQLARTNQLRCCAPTTTPRWRRSPTSGWAPASRTPASPIASLRATPAALRFLSPEPPLGPLPELSAVEQRGRIERQDHHPTNEPQAS